jgi:flagellar protein FlgJ
VSDVTPSATGIGGDTSRLGNQANLKKAGEKLEAMFTGLMLKEMRKAKLADPLIDSKAIDTFTEMGDAKVAQSMAEHQPIGIGQAVTRFLATSRAAKDNLNPGGASPPA